MVVWVGGLIFIVENKCKADCSSSPRLVPFSIPPCRPAGGLHRDLVQEQIYLSVLSAGVSVQGRFVRPTSTDRLLALSGVRKSPRTHFAAFNSTFLLDQYHILPNKITVISSSKAENCLANCGKTDHRESDLVTASCR